MDWGDFRQVDIRQIAGLLGLKVVANKVICFSGHDTTPSLHLYQRDNSWHCFGCGRHGDGLDLVRAVGGFTSNREASAWIARQGLSSSFVDHPSRRKSSFVATSRSSRQVSSDIYEWILDNSPLQHDGRDYLHSRGFSDATIARF